MTARRVVAVGLLALAGVFVVLLLERTPRRSGTDLTPNGAFVAGLGGGQEACQAQELLPAGTAALQLVIGTYGSPGPPLRVSISGPRGEPLTTGVLWAGWRQGVVRIPVRHVASATLEARVCLFDEDPAGSPRRIVLAGDQPDQGYDIQVAGLTRTSTRLRFDYMRPGRESWLELLPTIVYRSSLGKADLTRHWAWVAVLLLMLAAGALAVRTVLRDGPPQGEEPAP